MDGGAEELGGKPSEADPPQPQSKQQTMLLEGSSSVLNQQGKGRKGGSIASHPKTKSSPCQREDCQGGETEIYSGPSLPEDVWCHIHSLMPMRGAARAACVSRAFLRSWRCHPNLTFSNKIFRLDKNTCGNDEIARDFCSKVDCILKKHSGIGLKTLKIHMIKDFSANDSCYLDSWLQIGVTPGIEQLTLMLPMGAKYNFPCSILSNGSGDSIQHLHLAYCSFRPTAEFGLLRRLTRLHLQCVRISGDDLGCLLSNSSVLEWLEVRYCWIVYVKIPCMLQRLGYLEVIGCSGLKVIESNASNISSLYFSGDHRVQLSLGDTLQMKSLHMSFSGAVRYARVALPSTMPNLETATIYSSREADTPMLHSRYLHLKNLTIMLSAATFPATYDYFSLVSFLDACPSLEALALDVSQRFMEHVSIFSDPSDLRLMRDQHHDKVKSVKILGFTSAKSLVELTCHVVQNITSLECLTLETHQSSFRCSAPDNNSGKGSPLPKGVLMEARQALLAISTYIEPKVPSKVKLHVVETCSRCHAVEH